MKRLIIFFIMAALLAGGCGNREPGNILLEGTEQEAQSQTEDSPEAGQNQMEGSSEAGRNQAESSSEESRISKQEENMLYVQVSGAVKEPGVYQLAEGSRIFQAVELAGGLSEQADPDRINQAECVQDGQMIYIPAAGEQEPERASEDSQSGDGRINLNTATEAELMTLPGIGAAKAGSILAWREANGGFGQIEDLMKVEGIKDGVFAKIKDSVSVD